MAVICVRAHLCVKAPTCPHAVQHDGPCGPAMPCYSDPSGEISACVPVDANGEYQTHHFETCPHCKGRGRFEHVEKHKAPERKS